MSLFAEWTPQWPEAAMFIAMCVAAVLIVWFMEGCPWPRRRDR